MNQYLRWPTIEEITGLSRSTIWRLEEEGKFPRRRKLSKHLIGWLSSEVQAWLESRELAKGE